MHSSRMRTGRSVTVCRGGGGLCFLLGGAPFRGGCASFPGGVSFPACTEADPSLVNRITHTSKNITLATTSLRPVTRKLCQEKNIFTPLCQFTSQNSNSRPTSKMKSGGSVPGQRSCKNGISESSHWQWVSMLTKIAVSQLEDLRHF